MRAKQRSGCVRGCGRQGHRWRQEQHNQVYRGPLARFAGGFRWSRSWVWYWGGESGGKRASDKRKGWYRAIAFKSLDAFIAAVSGTSQPCNFYHAMYMSSSHPHLPVHATRINLVCNRSNDLCLMPFSIRRRSCSISVFNDDHEAALSGL